MTRGPLADGEAKGKIFSARGSIDASFLLAMLLVGLGSGSLALLGQAIRIILMTMTGLWSSMVHAAAAKDGGRRFEFGVGKLEQAGNMTIALALVVAGLWLAGRAFQLILAGKGETEPFGLALAASVHAVYTVRAGSSVWTRSTAEAGNVQAASGVPSPAPVSGIFSLLIVQTALTAAALTRDPTIALAADCSGTMFVALLMTAIGIKMLWEAVLDLIDHPLQGREEAAIAQLLLEHGMHPEELLGIRSRRSGRHVFVELTIDPVDTGSLEETRRRLGRARQCLEETLGGLDVSIRLHTRQDFTQGLPATTAAGSQKPQIPNAERAPMGYWRP